MDEQRGTIEYTGLKQLEPLEQTIVKGIAQEYLPIIQRQIHNGFDLLVHIKAHNKSPSSEFGKVDKRQKYSVHLKLIFTDNIILNVDKVHDWDLPKGMHESFVALLNRVKKEYKLDANKYKARKSANKSPKQVKRRERQISKSKKKQTIRRNAQKKRNKTY